MKNPTTFYLSIYSFLLLFSLQAFSQADQPPVVTASGNQIYCPGTPLSIVENFNITDPDDTGTNAIYIQISSGYVNGQDQLSLTPPIPNVTTTWNATTAKLIITGVGGQELPYTTLINAVNNVVYNSTSPNPTGTRTFSITVGEANYLPSTGHYYRFIPQGGISWTSAKTAAEASNYYGIQGYLATLLSAEEAQLCGEQSTGNGWIGGSDSQTEGVWRWMTGPEAGTIFWNGGVNGSTTNYENWNNAEPNNQGEEDYAHITAPGIGIPGSWNDLPNAGGEGNYAAQGYIAEYGGMPGDPVLQISGSTTITIPTVTQTTPAAVCGGGTLALSATVSAGTVHWYSAATGSNLLATGNNFTTPTITQTTIYYVSAHDATCTTAARTAVTATVNPLPTLTVITPVNVCGQSQATLQATPSAGTVSWYTQATGGTAVGTGATFITPALNANTTYYAEAVSAANCASAMREAVNITVTPLPAITSSNSPQYICESGTATLQATASAGTINWYDAATGGNLLATGSSFTTPNFTTPNVTHSVIYYAEAVNGPCLSATREAVTVNYEMPPAINSATTGIVCGQGSTTIFAGSLSPATINWYDTPTGGTILYTGTDFTTPVISANTVYYASAVSPQGCFMAQRTSIPVTVLPIPTVTSVTTPVSACEGSPVTLQGTVSAGQINWYDAPVGGQIVAVGNEVEFYNTAGFTALYAEVENTTCVGAARTQVDLIQYALPNAGPDEDLEFCENATIDLDALLTGVTYVWSTGETTQAITVDEPGEYEVEVTNANGCTDTKIFTVEMLAAPEIAEVVFTNSTATILMVNTDLENFEYSINGVDYQPTPTFSNLSAGQYTGYARSLIGCGEDEEDFVIYLIPKVISPNGDNINDEFTIAGMGALPKANVYILDRYGKLITQLNRANRTWDGTYKGRPVPATDYWYIIKIDDETPEIKGHFALVR